MAEQQLFNNIGVYGELKVYDYLKVAGVGGGIDFNSVQIENMRLENNAGEPGSPATGRTVLNTSKNNMLGYYDGGNWRYPDKREVQVMVVAPETEVETGDGQAYIHIGEVLKGRNLVYCHAEHITGGGGGSTTVQVHNVTNTVDMLSTAITIDDGVSGSDESITPYSINTANDDVAENDLLRIDVDSVPSAPIPLGAIITLGFE